MFGHLVLYYKGVHIEGIEYMSDICRFLLLVDDVHVDLDIIIMSLVDHHQYNLEDAEGKRLIDVFYVSPND